MGVTVVAGSPKDFVNLDKTQTITGSKTFLAGSATAVPLTAQAATGQTADIFTVFDPTGSKLAGVDSAGTLDAWYGIFAFPATAATRGLVMTGNASQTGNLQEWRQSGGVVRLRVSADGSVYTAGDRTYIEAGTGRISSVQENHTFGTHTFFGADPAVGVKATAPARSAFVARAFDGTQSANIAEFQQADGVVRTRVGRIGALGVNMTPEGVAWLAVSGNSATDTIVAIRGVASQTGNLQNWEDSAGTAVAHMSASAFLNIHNARFRGGQNSNIFTGESLIFTWANGTSYPHRMASRHNANAAADNAIDFHIWEPSIAAGTMATRRVLTVDGTGSVEIPTAGQGIIVKSPDGLVRRRIGIDNAGNLSLVAV